MRQIVLDLNLENAKVGTKVRTKKGFIFSKLKKGWKDETSGLIWLPIESKKYTHEQALKLQNDTKRLPTKKEFEEAEKHGIREIIDTKDKYYWSSSMYPGVPYGTYYFFGAYGDVFDFSRGSGVLCVGR